MDDKLLKEIFIWTKFCQKKYTLKFKKFLDLKHRNKFFQKFISKSKLEDYRVYLGGLRYLPFSISSFFKNLPIPWAMNRNLGLIVHDNKSLMFLDPNDKIIPEFSSALWSLFWIFNKREKLNRFYFKRLNFPIFDDDYSLDYNIDFKKFKIEYLDFNRCPENYIKTWFWFGNIYSKYYNQKKKKNLFYKDNFLKIITIKMEFQSGLYTGKNNQYEPKNKLNIIMNPFPCKEDNNLNLTYKREIGNVTKKNLLTMFPFLHQSKTLFSSKIFPSIFRKRYFNFCSKSPDKMYFYQSLLQSDFFFFEKLGNFKKYNFLKFCKKESLMLFNLIKPFFFDIFFSQRKLSFFLKFRFEFMENSSSFYSHIPTWNSICIEKMLLNLARCSKSNLKVSFLSLLKYHEQINSNKKKKNKVNTNINKIFKKNLYFSKTKSSWIKIGIKICLQSHKLLSILIKRKGLNYLNLDFNFNLKPIKTLSTKERKKSRFSNTFHFFREFLRFMKLIIDCHFKFYTGSIDFFQLSDGIHFIMTHVGKITGIYRYKYKIMKQIKICKSLKKILYEKFYDFSVPKGPGFGFWAPVWKVWVFFLRGMVPIQERWITNLLSRHFYGRRYSRKFLSVTKQRKEAYLDIELKIALLKEIENLNRNVSPKNNLKIYIKHSNEAWKNWKSNTNWIPIGLPEKIENLILDYIKTKSTWWIKTTCLTRESLIKGVKINKGEIKRNLGRLTRLWFKAEQTRQLEYLTKGPYVSANELFFIEEIFDCWVKICQFQKINFPSFKNRWDFKLLILNLDRIKDHRQLAKNEGRSGLLEKNLLTEAMKNPIKTFLGIKDSLLTQRIFFEISLNFIDNFSHLNPIYIVNFAEKITDGYLDQFLWLECSQKTLIPLWAMPADTEINPYSFNKLKKKMNDIIKPGYKEKRNHTAIWKMDFYESVDNFDLILMDKILAKILNPFIISYITSKNNVNLVFKDMVCLNSIGIIRGLQFSGLLFHLYYLIFDLLVLGVKNSIYLLKGMSTFISEKNTEFFIFYNRYVSKATFATISNQINEIEKLAVKIKIPLSLCFFNLEIVFEIQSLKITPLRSLSFEVYGFSLFFNSFSFLKGELSAKKRFKKKRGCIFIPKISSLALFQFENRIKQIIINSGSTTFTKISNKWNSSILGLITYFREFIRKNKKCPAILSKAEEKIQTRIKASMNSKMPSRFPLVLFFSPKELGGLGMMSVSEFSIPDDDLKYKKFTDEKNLSHDRKEIEKNSVPVIFDFVEDWKIEFEDSKKVWNEFIKRRNNFKIQKKTIGFEDIEDLWDKGIPRINTLFQKERELLAFDYGWRIRAKMEKFQVQRNNPFWWVIRKHDGKLWCLNFYKTQIIKNLGGVTNILEHSLFKGTYFSTWEGLFWGKSSGFEENLESKKLTHAQRSGLNQIPNRRFTLWWSPTINRANIYIGFQVQLDLTGIFMHGKIPTLKISLIQIFRAHLWQKIHQSITLNLCKLLEKNFQDLLISSIQKEQIHPRKSYKMNSSCADILLKSEKNWKIYKPMVLSGKKTDTKFNCEITSNFWIDIQLRWGDFDSHDIERYARGKFLDFTVYKNGFYPCKYGIIIAIDLSYNIFSGYGFEFLNLREILRVNLIKIMKSNPALYILRDRIRKGLQLYTNKFSESTLNTESYFELFNSNTCWLVDDSLFYRISVHQTLLGNIKTKPINGALIIFLPKNGNLILRTINSKTWKQHKKLSQLARWKAAEVILDLLQMIKTDEQPNKIVSLRKALVEPLEIQLTEYPTILIKSSNFKIPFKSLLAIEKINKKVVESKNCETIFSNLYDNWIDSVSSFTAFSRLILILKSIEINKEKVDRIFGFNWKENKGENFWPFFTDEEWVKNEIIFKDVILENFSYNNNIDSESLFQSEIRDIIFGSYKKNPNEFSIEKKTENNILHTVLTTNRLGKKLKAVVSFNNLKNQYISNVPGNQFQLSHNNFKILEDMKIEPKISSNAVTKYYIFPRNLLKKIIFDLHPNEATVYLILGRSSNLLGNIIEIRILIKLSENKKMLQSILSSNFKELNLLKSMQFIGYLSKMKQNSLKDFSLSQLNISEYTRGNFLNSQETIFVIIMVFLEKIYLKCLKFEYNSTDFNEISIFLSKKYFGFSMDFFDLNNLHQF